MTANELHNLIQLARIGLKACVERLAHGEMAEAVAAIGAAEAELAALQKPIPNPEAKPDGVGAP